MRTLISGSPATRADATRAVRSAPRICSERASSAAGESSTSSMPQVKPWPWRKCVKRREKPESNRPAAWLPYSSCAPARKTWCPVVCFPAPLRACRHLWCCEADADIRMLLNTRNAVPGPSPEVRANELWQSCRHNLPGNRRLVLCGTSRSPQEAPRPPSSTEHHLFSGGAFGVSPGRCGPAHNCRTGTCPGCR